MFSRGEEAASECESDVFDIQRKRFDQGTGIFQTVDIALDKRSECRGAHKYGVASRFKRGDESSERGCQQREYVNIKYLHC
jgi:hypothetical protein